jgi:hypothetical protein
MEGKQTHPLTKQERHKVKPCSLKEEKEHPAQVKNRFCSDYEEFVRPMFILSWYDRLPR